MEEAPEPKGLTIYFIDVEGGAATLLVAPSGESVLIDSGNPGDRDAGRIAAAAKEAGVTAIDYYITTHWHSDHVGGIGALSKLLPIRQIYGHMVPDPLPDDIKPELMAAWKGLSTDPHVLAPGDTITLKGGRSMLKGWRGTPDTRIRVLAADGRVLGEKEGAPAITTSDDGYEAKPEDTSDNARSVAMHISYGLFDMFAGGDLTWNIEHKLTCPKKIVPQVDVFLVDHHGLDQSNHPGLIRALHPEVAIVNNGARKGAESRTMEQLLKELGEVGVFQLHRNLQEGAHNTEPARIANDQEACTGQFIRLRVSARGDKFNVDVPARQTDRAYPAH
jgi:competence protein ComEC